MRASIIAAVLSAAFLAWSGIAIGQEPTAEAKARAREEFRRGIALEVAKDYEGALAAFRAVALVKSSPQVRFHIGVCEENVGDWVGAMSSYRLALLEAQESKVKDVEEEAQIAIQKLEPRVPRMTLVRGSGAAAARVIMDGRELGPASIGSPISVNAGPHSLEVSAPGQETAILEVVMAEGENREVGLSLKPVKQAPVGATPVGPKQAEPARAEPSPLLPVGITVAALGVASGIASGVFFGLRQSAIADLDAACGPDGQSCPEALLETRDDGELYSTISTATFIGAVSAVGLGGVLLIVELTVKPGSKGDGEDSPPVRAALSPLGFTLEGTF